MDTTSDNVINADFYREQGYLVVENLVPEAEIKRIKQRTKDIATGTVPEFPIAKIELEPGAEKVDLSTVRKLNGCAENDPVFLAHAKNNRILNIVQSLIGADIKLFGSQCFMKPPGGVKKPYHQDSAYFTIEPMNLVTCWTALDDVTLDKGPVWVIPGSHQQGLYDHGKEWLVRGVRGRRDKQVSEELMDRRGEKPILMSAGSCSFHHSLLLHRSTANHSNQARRGLAVHYMSSHSRWTDRVKPQPAYLLLRGSEYLGCV